MIKSKNVTAGTFLLPEGDTLMVTDPCYRVGTWCAGEIEKAKPGKWTAVVMHINQGWGERPHGLFISHETSVHDIPEEDDIDRWERLPNVICVDSGQAGFFAKRSYGGDDFYDECCSVSGNGGIVNNRGVVSQSGFGDGGYDCYVRRNRDGEVVAAFLDFYVFSDEFYEGNEDE